jgi:hypothetical protein
LANPKGSANPLWAICPILLHDVPFVVVQHVGGRSRMCVHNAWEISPTHIHVPVYLTKKNEKEQTKALPVEILGRLNFIIIIITLFLLFIVTIIITINIFLFYVFTQLFII